MKRLRRSLDALAAAIVLLTVATPLAHAQQAPAATPSPHPIPHVVIPDVDSLTISWSSAEPTRGVVLYGLTENELTSGQAETSEGIDHSVTIVDLPPDTVVYYLISDGSAPAGKGGRPYQARTNPSPVESASIEASDVVAPALGLNLVAPAGWAIVESPEETADEPILNVEGPGGSFLVTRQPAVGQSAEAWFQSHRADYHSTLVQPLGSALVAGATALIVGQPETCVTQAMLVAFVPSGDQMLVATYLEGAARLEAPEFVALISGLSTGDGPASPIDARFGRFPAAPPSDECGALQAVVQIAASATVSPTVQCPGAAMAIPAPGANQLPWGCFEYDPICRPYSKTSSYGSYFRLPHRGTDLAGEIGVTPVYATHAGTAVKLYASNIRISFSAPYVGKSVWMAHMASYDGRTDYRNIVSGQKVTTGQHIGYTGYYNTSGNPPHLHITYANNSYGTETWPTIDPTRMLSVKDAVWYSGWNAILPLECSAESADLFEPDNFHTIAPPISADGTPQHHDFHAPGDEDWIKFQAVAGKAYLASTSNLGARSDTSLAIVAADGRTVIAQNDDAALDTLASQIVWQAATSGTYYLRVRHYSFNGYEPFRPQPSFTAPVYGVDTGYDLTLVEYIPNILYARPSFASSYDATIPAKASHAIDGDLETRWASAQSPQLPQWWWAQADYQRFNRVDIYWDGDYAARYFIGWSNDNVTYTGYTFTLTDPGSYSHNMLALRSAKYIGVRMEELGPSQTAFSMQEVEAYRMPVTAASATAGVSIASGSSITVTTTGPADLVELTPEGEPIVVVREGVEADYTLFLPSILGQ